jgi:hypothetical protein
MSIDTRISKRWIRCDQQPYLETAREYAGIANDQMPHTLASQDQNVFVN